MSFIKKGPPYVGESHFKDKDAIKANGGRWNGELKKWEARTNEDLEKLIGCKLWLPLGMSEEGAQSVLRAIYEAKMPSKGDVGDMCFDRRHPKRSKFNDDKDIQVVNGHTSVYARRCDSCNILLDSRLQFGLECDCEYEFLWKACIKCGRPLHERAIGSARQVPILEGVLGDEGLESGMRVAPTAGDNRAVSVALVSEYLDAPTQKLCATCGVDAADAAYVEGRRGPEKRLVGGGPPPLLATGSASSSAGGSSWATNIADVADADAEVATTAGGFGEGDAEAAAKKANKANLSIAPAKSKADKTNAPLAKGQQTMMGFFSKPKPK